MLAYCIVFSLAYLILPAALDHADSRTPTAGVAYTASQQLFRQAYWAFQQYDYDTAASLWRRFIADSPDSLLLDTAYFYLGRSLLPAGSPVEARNAFEACLQHFPGSQHAGDIAFFIADSYYVEGDWGNAAQRYRSLSASKAYKKHALLPETHLKLGQCYERQAQFTTAWKTYHQARLKFAADPVYAALKSSEDALAAAQPEVLETYTVAAQLKDVDTLLKYGRASDARERLLPLIEKNLSSAQQSQLLLKLGQVSYTLRDNGQALVYFEQFLEDYPKSKMVTYVFDRIARLHLRRQDLESFENIYKQLKKSYPKSRYTAGAIRLKGKEQHLLGDYDNALQEYALFLKWYPTSSLVPEILWYTGWAHYQAGNYSQSLKTLDRLARSYPKSRYRDESLYWAAKSAEHLQQLDDAVGFYHKVRERIRRSYYGFLAQNALDRLAQRYPDLSIPAPTPVTTPPNFATEPAFTTKPGTRHYQASQELVDLGLYELAAGAFAAAIDHDKVDHAKYLELARLYNSAGNYHQQVRIMQGQFWKWIVDGDDSLPDKFWRLAYPQSFAPVVNQATAGSAVDPLLVYALMFAESVFDTDAYSPAGASGLMQLMPYTGARMAGFAGIPVPEPLHYFRPNINITLGTTYLAQLLDMFQGAPPPVIASYNAGETVVSTWWKAEHQSDSAPFITSIPYRETKNYVQKVLWYYWEYQRIYSRRP